MPTRDQLLRAIARRETSMRADLAQWVAIPTGFNHTSGLDEFRGVLLSRLERLGATIEQVPGTPRPEWLFSAKGDGTAGPVPPTALCRGPAAQGARVLLAGHLDTIFDPNGTFKQLTLSADGKTAIGPGVVDMKGGILIAITALEALAEVGIATSWTVLLNSDEETGSYHSESALRAEAARHDVGLAFEPALPDGSLAIERKGSGQFMIEARGRAAHAGRDFEKGASAVYALAGALVEVGAMSDIARGTTVNVGPLLGGEATNIVPDRACAWGNVRCTDAAAMEVLGARMDRLATAEGAMPRIIVRRSFNRPAKPRTPAVEALGLKARAVAESLGQKLPFASTGGVCDGNILQDAGLPTIDSMGVRGGGLHTHQEWIELASLVERAQLMACLLAELSVE